jgi:hypothetical protein
LKQSYGFIVASPIAQRDDHSAWSEIKMRLGYLSSSPTFFNRRPHSNLKPVNDPQIHARPQARVRGVFLITVDPEF